MIRCDIGPSILYYPILRATLLLLPRQTFLLLNMSRERSRKILFVCVETGKHLRARAPSPTASGTFFGFCPPPKLSAETWYEFNVGPETLVLDFWGLYQFLRYFYGTFRHPFFDSVSPLTFPISCTPVSSGSCYTEVCDAATTQPSAQAPSTHQVG